jgi:hypothetical protein
MHVTRLGSLAIVNFVLMLFIVFSLVQCFYRRNLKPPRRKIINSLIALTNQLYASLGMEGSEPAIRPPPASLP